MEEKKKGGSKEGRKEGREKEGGWMEKEAGTEQRLQTVCDPAPRTQTGGEQERFVVIISLPG